MLDNSRVAFERERVGWNTVDQSEVPRHGRIYNRFHAADVPQLARTGEVRAWRRIFDLFGETEAGLAYFLYKENF